MSENVTSDRAVALELRAQGWGYRRIANHLGVSKTTVMRWVRPGYAELSRAASRQRKLRYRGTCRTCGAPTNGSNGPGTASDQCGHCSVTALNLRRSAEGAQRMIDALRAYKAETGRTPTVHRWIAEHRQPWHTTAYYHFGSWHAALEAAGMKSRYASRRTVTP